MTKQVFNPGKRISTVIIDDSKEDIFRLQGFLELMPEIELVGTATNSQKAYKLIRELSPDLVFLDVEMPGKTGFELLNEINKDGQQRPFKVIFHTAYDKYTLQALRESAFDFLVKPPSENELKEIIQRFRSQLGHPADRVVKRPDIAISQMAALPTNTGLQFIPKSEIVFVVCQKSSLGFRSIWSATLNDQNTVKLRANTRASDIISYLGPENFIALNQSIIVNISFVNQIEYKTHDCYLFPPFDTSPVRISRHYMAELRERFDLI